MCYITEPGNIISGSPAIFYIDTSTNLLDGTTSNEIDLKTMQMTTITDLDAI